MAYGLFSMIVRIWFSQCPFGIWEIWGELQSKISQLKDLWPSVNPYCMVRKQEIKEETSSGMKAQCRGGDLII
jgi:hypothetical protein